jgi:hypothetical protein
MMERGLDRFLQIQVFSFFPKLLKQFFLDLLARLRNEYGKGSSRSARQMRNGA